MKIETTRFGIMDVKEAQTVTSPQGLLGYTDCTRFTLFPDKTCEPFQWLQSLELPSLAWVVADPEVILKGYRVSINDSAIQDLGSVLIEDFQVLAVVTVSAKIQDFTVNLLAPILINKNTRLARQIVLSDSAYSADHRILGEQTK